MDDWEEAGETMLGGGKLVKAIAEVRDNATGVVREYECEEILGDGESEPCTFIWKDGNYSCDCNRSLFFARAAGDAEDFDKECSDGKYSVRVRNKKSGRVFYSEF